MPQQNISMDIFREIIYSIPEGTLVHLQGEGEPLLHPQFMEMIALCRESKLLITTTTNGTIPFDISLVDGIRVSVDTLDVATNSETGRHHFDKTLLNLSKWIDVDRTKITICTTDYGQDLTTIRDFCALHQVRHFTQRLNQKQDYSKCYDVQPIRLITSSSQPKKPRCMIMANKLSYYFDVNGTKLPCCFIKFPVETYDEMVTKFANGEIPTNCTGCDKIRLV